MPPCGHEQVVAQLAQGRELSHAQPSHLPLDPLRDDPAAEDAGYRAQAGPRRVADHPQPPAAEVVRHRVLVAVAQGLVDSTDGPARAERESLERSGSARLTDHSSVAESRVDPSRLRDEMFADLFLALPVRELVEVRPVAQRGVRRDHDGSVPRRRRHAVAVRRHRDEHVVAVPEGLLVSLEDLVMGEVLARHLCLRNAEEDHYGTAQLMPVTLDISPEPRGDR